jgi:hypothetical protein
MSNDTMKTIRNQVRNGYGVETKPEYLAEIFLVYPAAERARILNQMDEAESFEGATMRETSENMGLRIQLEAAHQAGLKAGK